MIFLSSALSENDFVLMESMIPRSDFVKVSRADSFETHEITIAVQLRNLDQLETILLDRSNPRSDRYQEWLTFNEVGSLITNEASYDTIIEWLLSFATITVTWSSIRLEYVKVSKFVFPLMLTEPKLVMRDNVF